MNTSIKSINLSNVILKDPYYINSLEKEIDYLLSLDTDRLLAGFRENAGLDTKGAQRYDGWEKLLIGGHTFGHVMTAMVQAYESATTSLKDKEALLSRLQVLTSGLKECQDAIGTGLVFAAPVLDGNIEKQFDNVEELKGEIFTQAWVPWYTLHKIIAGLVTLCNIEKDNKETKTLSQEAVTIVSGIADWAYNRVSKWDEETHKKIFIIEYGGMNDCLYDVYMLTHKEEHLKAAHAFDEEALFEKVLNSKSGENVLENVHANTTIPKYIGAMKRYLVTGEEKYLRYVEKFVEYVICDHTYITGGNSEWEHFRKDRMLNEKRTNCNCETCNVYNFLKLTALLFKTTGDVKYADIYENAFLNSIMSSQNPETGMTTYFQPMASGYFKTYGTRTEKFWCCTGSGMENFTKLGQSFYYKCEDGIIVNQFVSSDYKDEEAYLVQKETLLDDNKVTLEFKSGYNGNLYVRKPYWASKEVTVLVNGTEINYETVSLKEGEKGYIKIDGSFAIGSRIEITLPMGMKTYTLYDCKNVCGFKYGPYVLSACLGNTEMITTKTGVDVTIPEKPLFEKKYVPSESETVKILNGSVKELTENPDKYFEIDKDEDGKKFILKGTDSNLVYILHYTQHKQRYGIYFKFE